MPLIFLQSLICLPTVFLQPDSPEDIFGVKECFQLQQACNKPSCREILQACKGCMRGSQGGLSNAARWLGLALNHAADSRRVKPQNMLRAGNLAALSNYLLSLSPLQQFSLIAMKINAIQHTRTSMRIGMLVRSSVHTANQFYILLSYCVKSYLNSSLFDHN